MLLSTLLTLAAGAGDHRVPDSIELVSGAKLEGRVVYHEAGELVLRNGTRDKAFPMKEVRKVFARAENESEALLRWFECKPAETIPVLAVASFCERMDLLEEANLFRWQVLWIDPHNEEARSVLGHEQHGGEWGLRQGSAKQWISLTDWAAAHKDWKSAWELSSTHYRIKSDLPFRTNADALLDLECLYYAFFKRCGSALHSFEVIEPMPVELHATRDSYPEKIKGRMAYYEPSTNAVYIDASNGLDRGLLYHEAVHQLLCNSGARDRVQQGVVPPWLDEGLAEYVRFSMIGPSARPQWEDRFELPVFQRLARESDGFELSRVLNYALADFDASPKGLTHYAQAYTLVAYFLRAGGDAYRLRFLDWLRQTYRGKSAPPQFLEALSVDAKTLEAAWKDFVKKTAGPLPAVPAPR